VTAEALMPPTPGAAPRPGGTGRTWADLEAIPLTRLKGVGPARAKALASIGLESVADLLREYPRRYLDRRRIAPIRGLAPGDEATVVARVESARLVPARRGRARVEVVVADETGQLRLTFFNQPWRVRQLRSGEEVAVFGRVETFAGRRQMTNPVVDLLGTATGRIVPVYRASEQAGVHSWQVAAMVAESLRRAGRLADPLSASVRRRHGLRERTDALWAIHQPRDDADRVSGRRRLVFDELLALQLPLAVRRAELERRATGLAHPNAPRAALVTELVESLPFPLTGAQRRAIETIALDLARPVPMHRLLQGDVGSGKTLVALASALAVVDGGSQAALLVPTEVLAEQHHAVLGRLLDAVAVRRASEPTVSPARGPLARIGLLTARVTGRRRAELLADLAAGRVDVIVGTHALLSEGVDFRRLGLVVVDEQHRFGVAQRAALVAASAGRHPPHLLVMTATPIPRSAAMTVFGDLDLTVLDERPVGRAPVTTVHLTDEEAADAWTCVRREVAAGGRAYVVCPLVEGSTRIEARAASEERERLADGPLAGIPIGLVHGQLALEERTAAMEAFRSGATPVVVATTVVEVGVDVPEATVMVVRDADRFGLAQLHQLRGRVGRGRRPGWCYLLTGAVSPDAARRLAVLCRSTDGFVIAEEDLRLRGPGTIFGLRQRGRGELRLADLVHDGDLVQAARAVAAEIVAADPDLRRHRLLAAEAAWPEEDLSALPGG